MDNVKRTCYVSHLMTCKAMNRPFTILPNSTLNQKFNIYPNEVPNINEYPVIGYIGIGNKGASYELGTDGYILTTPIPHLARHASLYNFIPFLVRPINDDISATERARYRMRVIMTIGGEQYIAYYLRALTLTDISPSVELRNVNDGIITTSAFNASLSDLSPVHVDVSNTDINDANGDYLVSTAKVLFTLNQQDINEILNACNLIHGDPRYAVINELAVCSGVDKVLQGSIGGTTVNYTETIATQIATFIYQYHPLTENTSKVQIELDIGSVDPII